jgi:hypothetical protein
MPIRLESLLISAILSFTPLAAWTQSPIAGDWQGLMKVDGTNLHLVLHIRQASDGTYSALIDSLNQDAANIPVKTVNFADSTLRLDIAQVSATYVGDLSKDGKELRGVWNEGKDHNLSFKRVSDSERLQQPIPIGGDWEGSFDEAGVQKDVHLHIDTASCTTIVGTLDIPQDGVNGIQIPKITFQKGMLAFSVKPLRLTYSGTLNDNDSKFGGIWKQGHPSSLTLRRALHPFRVYERPEGCRG